MLACRRSRLPIARLCSSTTPTRERQAGVANRPCLQLLLLLPLLLIVAAAAVCQARQGKLFEALVVGLHCICCRSDAASCLRCFNHARLSRLFACSNPDVGRAELKRFHEVQEAYRVLRDEDRRRQYDAMRVGWMLLLGCTLRCKDATSVPAHLPKRSQQAQSHKARRK